MDRGVLMAIVIAFAILLLALMALGWRSRRRRQAGIAAPVPVPTEPGTPLATLAGKYVATCASGDPLDRIAVHGLGFRGPVELDVHEAGVLVRLPDARVWIPAADLRDLRRATWTIDRVVESDGLQLIEWSLGDRVVDSYFRMDEPRALDGALRRLLGERKAA